MNLGLLAAGVGDVGGLLEGSEAGHAAKRLAREARIGQLMV
jgi:hypothetical protein